MHAEFWGAKGGFDGELSWVLRPTDPVWDQLVRPFMEQHAAGAFLDPGAVVPAGLPCPAGTKPAIAAIASNWRWINEQLAKLAPGESVIIKVPIFI